MLKGRNTPSCVVAILFGVAFTGEGVRRRCFGFLLGVGIAAAWRRSPLSFFSPLRLEVLVGLYRQGTEQGDAPPPLLCIHEKDASAVACSHQQIVRHTTSLVHEGYSPMCMIFPCMHMCYTRGVCWETDSLRHATYKSVYLVSGCLCLPARGTAGLRIHTACMQRSWLHLTYARDKNFEFVTI
jgi:hypothetical protein